MAFSAALKRREDELGSWAAGRCGIQAWRSSVRTSAFPIPTPTGIYIDRCWAVSVVAMVLGSLPQRPREPPLMISADRH
ncbi:hypothetical protein LTR16_010774, partial [Cryomyces antarcticus]